MNIDNYNEDLENKQNEIIKIRTASMNEQKKINDKFNHINKNLQKEIKATVEGERKCKAKQNNK